MWDNRVGKINRITRKNMKLFAENHQILVYLFILNFIPKIKKRLLSLNINVYFFEKIVRKNKTNIQFNLTPFDKVKAHIM